MDYIKLENIWTPHYKHFMKTNGVWIEISDSAYIDYITNNISFYGGSAGGNHSLSIMGLDAVSGESLSYSLIYDRQYEVSSAATWLLLDGNEYATISGNTITILSGANNSQITVKATYQNLTAVKNATITYKTGGNTETETIIEVDESGNTTTEVISTTTNEDGTTETNTNSTTVDESGNTIGTTETTTVVNEDGSSSSNTVTTTYDESGNTIGSTESNTTTETDGSYNSNTTNYDGEGNATDGVNVTGDTNGNVNTQDVVYDENGDSAVTGYVIDTSENPDGTKNYNGDGVNTDYYAFDLTQGFVLDFNFIIDFNNQPPNQNENHHNILTMKRANPSPWYGFQLRHSSTNKYVMLGTQFSTGSNTNTNITGHNTTSGTSVKEYNLRVIYDPTISTNEFVVLDMYDGGTGTSIFTQSKVFPDIEDLKYLKVTIGYAMDENGDPFRYSNIDVKNFMIKRLPFLETPTISCDGQEVTISCPTEGAEIYYRVNQTGNFVLYTEPFPITANTIVESYAVSYGRTSSTVSEECIYSSGEINPPLIVCNGQEVTIASQESGATIYYRLDEEGEFSEYTVPFPITADTIVEAYAEKDGNVSETVSETCIYTPEHEYENDYLTLQIKSGGTLEWTSVSNATVKQIQYSVNGGTWTPVVQPSPGTSVTIPVSDNDVVRLKGINTSYSDNNDNYVGFSGSTAVFDVEGNIMSLVYGDSFIGKSALTGSYNFCGLFKLTHVESAENLILPSMELTPHCYRAMFANSSGFTMPPELPATVLAEACYRFMFQDAAIRTAPELPAQILTLDCYDGMFMSCKNLNYIKCAARDISASAATYAWVRSVSASGTFVQYVNTEWSVGESGIPQRWVKEYFGSKTPVVFCDGLQVTLECDTSGASIYYRLGQEGEFSLYTAPIPLSADTIVEAYSQTSEDTSPLVTEPCIYDDGIMEPVIYCDGEYVSISCDTGGADISYRLNQEGSYSLYTEPFPITADTIVESYSEISGRRSETVSANCIYDASLKAPIIECDGFNVTITCHSSGADIYYRVNQEGSYSAYTASFPITADTIVEAYSELDLEMSSVVSATCIYNPVHDYSLDYLTFVVTSDGTIVWNSIGSGQAKAIQYSKNNGPWVSITASTSTTISVSSGDTVMFKGVNSSYAKDKSNYSGFEGGTATFNIEGNIMSLIYGDNFVGQTAMTGTFNFCSLFKLAKCVSAENLVLPSTELTQYCYRAMFSKCTDLIVAPALPATTLNKGCYWYLFEECAITEAPELLAETLVAECYGFMFTGCRSLNYIKCMAITGFSTTNCKQNWVNNVASTGTFVKDSSVSVSTWTRGAGGIPTNWLVYDDVAVVAPVVLCDGYNNVTITCETSGATIYYKTGQTRAAEYTVYTDPFVISQDVIVEAYSELNGQTSRVVTQTCEYLSDDPYEYSNRNLNKWNYNGNEVETPYSVNAIDGHSQSYAKGTFNFETSFSLRDSQPTYLWFQHADQSASVYVDDTLVEKHWGGYNSFFVDITSAVHSGTNRIKVGLKNNEGNNLAPCSGDFNFNGTLGKVKLYTSPYLPAMNYGYDGFHVTSDVADSSATIYVRTTVPTGATVTCEIDDGTYHFGTSGSSTGEEMIFSTTITNPHLWNGKLDPHLYTITMEIYAEGEMYHRYVRPYGLRYYRYAINETVSGETYTGFLLNGQPYLLRGCCMHDDIVDKANALDDADYAQTFAIIQELGCNFLRLAHYPHPRETYDWCDRLGIVVQTEVPMVNVLKSTQPTDYYTHLESQNIEMVNQHFNHPCIMFWGLGNEFNAQMDSASFACTKLEYYRDIIRSYDTERLIGCVLNANSSNPRTTVGGADLDWYGCNIYVGWYSDTNSNNPSSKITQRLNNVRDRAIAYSEYGCGGTQHCHSDDFMTTTTRGNHERHDIEYMMWLHEGQIAAIKNFPQLIFTSEWQLFDIAVASRNEGYTVCLDGENTSTDNELRRLNDKGLVERDHVTKKDPFYLYKAWWNTTDKFVHICGKDYTKTTDRVIKCYTNDGNELSLYVNGNFVETVTVTDNIATFTANTYSSGDIIEVEGNSTNDVLVFS